MSVREGIFIEGLRKSVQVIYGVENTFCFFVEYGVGISVCVCFYVTVLCGLLLYRQQYS